jgi:ribosomal protein L11 methyltransferase
MSRSPLWQISVATTLEAEEAAGAALGEIFAIGTTSYTDLDHRTATVSVCLTHDPAHATGWRKRLKYALTRIRQTGLPLGAGKVSVRRLRKRDWAESWKQHFKPLAIGGRLLVKPSWSRRRPRKGQALVVLDPGLSFGTGQHPTTRFCLEQLVTHRRAGRTQSFLDVGTGSGILAIAAAALGYRPVEAMDFDPDAVRVARANARANRVGRRIRFSRADITKLRARSPRKHRVVCANLLADLLLTERDKLVGRLADDGVLVVAGILRREFAEVRQAYERAGLRLAATRAEAGWQSGSFVLA